jgi:hypothetical protein
MALNFVTCKLGPWVEEKRSVHLFISSGSDHRLIVQSRLASVVVHDAKYFIAATNVLQTTIATNRSAKSITVCPMVEAMEAWQAISFFPMVWC